MHPSKVTESHHSRIIAALRRAIHDGNLAPGQQLPKETELSEQYGVSRMTMNKVLTRLTMEGYLVRRRRGGTFVAQPRGQAAVMEINDIEHEVEELGFSYAWRLTSLKVRPLLEPERALLEMPPDYKGNTLVLEGVHYARGEPFCLELRAINLDVATEASGQDFSVTVPGRWLLSSMPFSEANHRIRAINAAGRDARLLDVALGTACLEILRKTKIEQAWVTHVRLFYPGELHQLVADFSPHRALVQLSSETQSE
jgi:GntR family histidine utilization transcriptional repressor